MEKINYLLNNKFSTFSICNGLAGYGWLLLQIKNNSIDIDAEYLFDLDEMLFEELNIQISSNNFDFLHGAIGIIIYFIERYKSRKDNFIECILTNFTLELIQKIHTNLNMLLEAPSGVDNSKCYYFGLAHGVSGLMNFLVHLDKSFLNSKIDITLPLTKCLNFLLQNKKFNEASNQFYPNSCDLNFDNNTIARLSWCQGDLGISNALFNVGLFLKDDSLIKESLALLENTQKIDLDKSFVKDFGFCHGSVGIMVQFYLMSKKTGFNYDKSILYWKNQLEFQTKNYQTFESFVNNAYCNDTTVLTGAVGLALSIMTMEGTIDSKWLTCFNLF